MAPVSSRPTPTYQPNLLGHWPSGLSRLRITELPRFALAVTGRSYSVVGTLEQATALARTEACVCLVLNQALASLATVP